MRLVAFTLILALAGAAAAQPREPDDWTRMSGQDIEARIGGRVIIGRYVEDDRGFQAAFERGGAFSETWTEPLRDRNGNPVSRSEGRWFIQGDLLCEKLPALAEVPFCGTVYERQDDNLVAYKFVNPHTGRVVSYSTHVQSIEPLN